MLNKIAIIGAGVVVATVAGVVLVITNKKKKKDNEKNKKPEYVELKRMEIIDGKGYIEIDVNPDAIN